MEQAGAAYLSMDSGQLGCKANHLRCWRYLARKASDFSLVLEDDAVLTSGFTDQLHSALDNAPTPVVSLYLGRQRPRQFQDRIAAATQQAEVQDASWIIGNHLLHAVAVAIRTDLLPSLLGRVTDLPIDHHISVWARQHRHQISYSWPSLVDHQDGPTLVNHPDGSPRTPGRTAWRTGTRTSWTSRSVEL